MANLPHVRLLNFPLVVCDVAISIGIFLGHSFKLHSNSVLLIDAGASCFLVIVIVWHVAKQKLVWNSLLVFAAFAFAGIALSLTSNHVIATNKISRMFEEGSIVAGEP